MKNKTKTLFIICGMLIGFSTAVAGTAKFAQAINPTTELNTPIPGGNEATDEVSGLAEYLQKIYNFGIATAGILAMVMITVGGFMYLTSSYTGNVAKTANGLEYIKSALTGLAIVLLSYLLIYTLDPELTKPKNVFMDIPLTTCNGGMANVEDAGECEKLCTVTTDVGVVTLYPTYIEDTKCCTCEQSIECLGDNAHPNIPISGCDLYCKDHCPEEKTCKMDAVATSDVCCKCFITQYEDLAVPTVCERNGGISLVNNATCNALPADQIEQCRRSECTTFCHVKDPAAIPNYSVNDQCCMCTDYAGNIIN